jgi:hypothetical protein
MTLEHLSNSGRHCCRMIAAFVLHGAGIELRALGRVMRDTTPAATVGSSAVGVFQALNEPGR